VTVILFSLPDAIALLEQRPNNILTKNLAWKNRRGAH
jgi:hypothetical protein